MGSDGLPPYHILIVPYGPTPLPNNIEVRPVIDQQLQGNTTTFSFPINYPANSQFVAVVSDAHNFGSGGTSIAITVADSNDNSCFSISKPWSPLFYLYVDPDEPVQCGAATISWDTARAQGTPTFQGVIPGGQSFVIQESVIKNVSNSQTGFTWVPSMRAQTHFLIVGGDDRGMGTGGSEEHTIGNSGDGGCLNNLSPSSTPGTPAGSYATSTSTSTSSTSTSTSSGSASGGTRTKNVALIGGVVGGAVGGLLVIILVTLASCHLLRRSRRPRPSSAILGDYSMTTGSSGPEQMSSRNSRLAYYTPEPFSISGPTTGFSNERMDMGSSFAHLNPRQSGLRSLASTSTNDRSSSAFGSGHGDLSTASSGLQHMRKGSLNILQHEDAGPSDPMLGPESTIELPPEYDAIRPTNLS